MHRAFRSLPAAFVSSSIATSGPRWCVPQCVLIALLMLPGLSLADRYHLQVEEFEGPWRRQTNIAGFEGTGFCTSNANPQLASSVMETAAEIRTAGTYVVWVRGYTSDNSNRALQAEVAGQRLAVTHQGSQRGWFWEKAGEVQLPAGPVAIVIRDAGDGFESADAVLLTSDPEDDPAAAETHWRVYDGRLPAEADALRYNIRACVEISQLHQPPEDRGAWEARRPQVERALKQALGFDPPPQKTPLQPQITGRAERDGYTIENLLFQSRPGFYVTANLYKPAGIPGRLPAVIVTMGHATEPGKNFDLYRAAQLGLVDRGFLVLAYDPIGQGERRIRGNSHSVSYPALLTGQSNLHYMIWDTIRGLDYLLTRDDVAADRIGVCGNSGGGLNTMYAMPAEPRFAAGASCCCLCSFAAWVRDGGDHCICNHLPGIVPAMEQFEFVGLCQPRAFLACNGEQDAIFPVVGVRETISRASQIYGLYDEPERVGLVTAPLGHGWSQPLREACYGWFAHWLQDAETAAPIAEVPRQLEDARSPDLQVLKDGRFPEDARTYVQLVRAEAQRLVDAYPPIPEQPAEFRGWQDQLRGALKCTLGDGPQDFTPTAHSRGEFTWRNATVRRLSLRTEPQMEVSALMFQPQAQRTPAQPVVLLADGGKESFRNDPVLAGLLDAGCPVLAVDVRATGEAAVRLNQTASNAVLLGRPLLAQQAWDLTQAAAWLKREAGRGEDCPGVAVYARGKVGLIALLAAAGSDLSTVVLDGAPESFLEGIADPLPFPMWAYASKLLQVADVPQLAAAAGPGVVRQLDGSNADEAVAELIGGPARD